jgi:hypothetical protein
MLAWLLPRPARLLVCGLTLMAWLSGGCGLVFQGTTQELLLSTQPPGARVHFQSQDVTSPATITVRRRFRDEAVLKAEADRYYPACQVVDCGAPKWIKVLDSIPAAIPLLIDVAFGTLGSCDVSSLRLEPLPEEGVQFTIPDDSILLSSYRRNFDICRYPYFFDPEFTRKASRIVVTAGGLQRAYKELGPVDFGREGSDVTQWTGIVVANVGVTEGVRTFSKATPAEINEILRRHALRLYGEAVDAVSNVAYETNPKNDVFGTGLAVHFTNQEADGTAGAVGIGSRLEDLIRARDKGLISPDEYNALRKKRMREC